MKILVEHFLDAGQQDANGEWGYFYEGDPFTFSADSNAGATLRARIYSDTPTRASFLDSRDEMDPSPFVDEAVAYLRSRGATEIYYLGPAGYDIWSRAE